MTWHLFHTSARLTVSSNQRGWKKDPDLLTIQRPVDSCREIEVVATGFDMSNQGGGEDGDQAQGSEEAM